MRDKILSFDQIAKGLKHLRLHRVAKECKLSYPVLKRMADRRDENFTLESLRRVSSYIISHSTPILSEILSVPEIRQALHNKRLDIVAKEANVSAPLLVRFLKKPSTKFREASINRITKYIKENNQQFND